MASLRGVRRFVVCGVTVAGFVAVAAVAPSAVVLTTPAGVVEAACPNGEENDTYTQDCVPYLVPNSSESLCPQGVSGAECAPVSQQPAPTPPPMPGQITPGGPEQQLQDVSTPDF